jgi:hypothetical protein
VNVIFNHNDFVTDRQRREKVVTIEEMKRRFGDEYPAAVVVNGVRMPLHKERRFSRSYGTAKSKMWAEISRFMDGSVSITVEALQSEWPTWDETERWDFCSACCWLNGQADYPDMLRFLMEHAGPKEWSSIASSVATQLPQDEAFDILSRVLQTTEIGSSANIAQAIAHTKHPKAEATLRAHFMNIWAHKSLWDDDKFLNWVAFDATTCIQHLIETGASPEEFKAQAMKLSEHVCSGNRKSWRTFLSKHYAS